MYTYFFSFLYFIVSNKLRFSLLYRYFFSRCFLFLFPLFFCVFYFFLFSNIVFISNMHQLFSTFSCFVSFSCTTTIFLLFFLPHFFFLHVFLSSSRKQCSYCINNKTEILVDKKTCIFFIKFNFSHIHLYYLFFLPFSSLFFFSPFQVKIFTRT